MPQRTLLIIAGIAVGVITLFGALLWVGSIQQRRITVGVAAPTLAQEPSPPDALQPTSPPRRAATTTPALTSPPTARPAAQLPTTAAPTLTAPEPEPVREAEVPATFDDFSLVSSGWAPLYIDDAGQYNGYSAGAYAFSIAGGTQPVYDIRAPLQFTPTHYAVELRLLSGAGEAGLLLGVRGSPVDFASLAYTRVGVSSDGQLVIRSKEPGRDERTLATSAIAAAPLAEAFSLEVSFEGDTAHVRVDGSAFVDLPGIVKTPQLGLYAQSAGGTFAAESDNLLLTAAQPGQAEPACSTLRDLFLAQNPADYLDGFDVLLAQQRLLQIGYNPGEADGFYGANTDRAVRDFQRANGIDEPWVTTQTWCRLLSGQAITAIDALTDRARTGAFHRRIEVDPAAPLSAPMLVSLRQSDETWRIAMMLPGRTTLQYLETQGDAFDPALAPDHARIAFTSTRDNGSVGRIWLLDLTTGALRPISDPQLDCQFPAWSPDGLSLIYTADQPGTTEPVARNYIYQVRSDLSTRWVDAHTGWSDWSSRNEIVFTRNTGQSYDLFRANSDGSGLVNLTNSVDANEDIAAWSPDGQMIAFVRNARDGSGDRQVMVMDRDGANMRQLTSFPGPNSNPAWLPDGQWLLFANQLDEQTRQPWLLNIRTGTLTRVAANTDRVWFMSGVR